MSLYASARNSTHRCVCGDYLTQHYALDLRCANPTCACQQYRAPRCPDCGGSIYDCGYDPENGVCPEYEAALAESQP